MNFIPTAAASTETFKPDVYVETEIRGRFTQYPSKFVAGQVVKETASNVDVLLFTGETLRFSKTTGNQVSIGKEKPSGPVRTLRRDLFKVEAEALKSESSRIARQQNREMAEKLCNVSRNLFSENGRQFNGTPEQMVALEAFLTAMKY